MIKELKVGKTVYIKAFINGLRCGKIYTVVISKVGRKWFKVDGKEDSCKLERERFCIETMRNDGECYTSYYKVYLSLQDIEDESECSQLNKDISSYFAYGKSCLSLEKLRKIKQIIDS